VSFQDDVKSIVSIKALQLCRRPTLDERRPSRAAGARPLALTALEREVFFFCRRIVSDSIQLQFI
jgi:hypothetical protein